MASLTEQLIINELAKYARSVDGIKNAYDFASNPDNLTSAMLPAVLFVSNFEAETKGHFNLWRNQFNVTGVLFVAERMSRGGTLKFLENTAIPFGMKFRQKFQDNTVLSALLGLGDSTTQAWLISGNYGAGGPLLTHNGIEYVGWVFNWTFLEIN